MDQMSPEKILNKSFQFIFSIPHIQQYSTQASHQIPYILLHIDFFYLEQIHQIEYIQYSMSKLKQQNHLNKYHFHHKIYLAEGKRFTEKVNLPENTYNRHVILYCLIFQSEKMSIESKSL